MTTIQERIAITGLGFAVGSGRRGNEDPIFDWLRCHNVDKNPLFQGYKTRAVLEDDETLGDIMTRAASAALAEARTGTHQIDAIIGYGTVSEYLTPNVITEVHHRLGGMRDDCWLMPVQSEYTNYLVGIKLADLLISQGQASKVLVVCGCNWTRHVDYHEPPSISVGDGACAAVVSRTRRPNRFAVMASDTLVASQWYGAMSMSQRPLAPPGDGARLGLNTKPVFNLGQIRGVKAFKDFGMNAPPTLVNRMLKKHRIDPGEVTVISHQASTVLLNAWRDKVQPAAWLDTLQEFGNLTLASVGVTFAHRHDEIDTPYLILLGIGVQQETSAMLLKREKTS
jgi:3-oxoacyl-[acyl-carrier-protein] synthase III